jgi:hypothetical protein
MEHNAGPAPARPAEEAIIKPEGIMVDIETLSTHPFNAAVLSIGAVRFAMKKDAPVIIGTPYLSVLDLNAQIAAGREVSNDTIKFWRDQTPEARKHWADGTPMRVNDALHSFYEFYGGSKDPDLPIWANGICFDIGNLESLYRQFFPPNRIPWKYNATRDARTMYRAIPELRSRPPSAMGGADHDPVVDCRNQVWGLWEHWPHFD